ncbi:GRAS family transcription factor [Tripterygium wilfordii]|uniref:GRAS family transcription factor n=1 Tax=Tripterygium wilfordii TaxID=458696 RepID=A0A7J7CVU1_TRIWF|nr:protein SHORT-ROOT-like [Tripterygium wilfordii]KAF5738255.1 GRAS family transcription factor [Tripterygium wilfordii]
MWGKMDTLFRLVGLQQQQQQQSDQLSFNNSTSRTSSSSRSSRQYHNHHIQEDPECFNPFMDDEDFSSSSSKHYNLYPYHHHQSTPTTTSTPSHSHHSHHSHHAFESSTTTTTPDPQFSFDFSCKWASHILLETARAIAEKDSIKLQQLMWMLNELSSPYGDTEQKLASYFLQALFSRMTDSGLRCYDTLSSASEKISSFESTRKTLLKFQELSPWITFGHVASNGAIIESFEGETKLHIIDISNTCCTQWPTLLESLATRSDETPHLRLTTVVVTKKEAVLGSGKVMVEIGRRMEKFARLMGVPFEFNVVNHIGDLSDLNFRDLDVRDDEALAINIVGTLHSITPVDDRRDYVISNFRRLNPRIMTVVEEEADLDVGDEGLDFVHGFQECLRFFRIYFESLDESFPRANNERLMLERGAGRAIVDLLAGQPSDSIERRECATSWTRRLHGRGGGFSPVAYSDEVCDDVRALLRRYKEGCWSMTPSTTDTAGIFLSWKDQPVVWASAWRP